MLVLVIRTTVSLRPLAAPSHWPRPQSTRLQASSESDFSSIARGLLADMEALGEVRFVVQGAGAILESMGESRLPEGNLRRNTGRFDNLRYSDTQRGPLATVSTPDPPFECHLFLNEVHAIRWLTVTKLDRVLRITRFLAADDKTLLSVILAPSASESEVQAW